MLNNNSNKTKGSDFWKGRESLPDCVRCHIQFSCRSADQVVFRRGNRGWLYLKKAASSGHCESCPSLFPSNWAELLLECKCWRIILTQGRRIGGERGLLATSLGLIGGFWPEKGEHLWRGSAKLSMWQPHWWDQLFWVQRTVITSSPVLVVFFFPPPLCILPPSPFPSLVRWLRVLSSFQAHLNLASVDVCVSPGDFIHQ